jgi:hypothetical protein
MGAIMRRREALFLLAALINPFKKTGPVPYEGGVVKDPESLPFLSSDSILLKGAQK